MILLRIFILLFFIQDSYSQQWHIDEECNNFPYDGHEVGTPKPGTLHITDDYININYNVGTYSNAIFLFDHICIPAGATILAASLEVNVNSTTTDDPNFTIYGELNATPNGIDASNYISSRSITDASHTFSLTGIGTGYYAFTGLEDIVQEIIDLSDWVYGWSHIAFITKDTLNSTRFVVYSNTRGGPYTSKLHITWSGVAPPDDPTPERDWTYVSVSVSDGADDGYYYNGGQDYTSNEYFTNYETNIPLYSLIRFQEVPLPQGAVIADASLELWSVYNYDPEIEIHGELIADSSSFTDGSVVSARDVTYASAYFSLGPLPSGAYYGFDHIGAVVQEVVDLPEWEEGNSFSIIGIDGEYGQGKMYRAVSYEGGHPARLNVAYIPICAPAEYIWLFVP